MVAAGKAALAKGEVTPVLMWVEKHNEGEIRAAFAKTLAVRAKGPEARDLADMYFFETLVRVHRQSEGEFYTGLKPAEVDPGAAVAAADKALEIDVMPANIPHAVHAAERSKMLFVMIRS